MSNINERLDKVLCDVQDLKSSQSFHGDQMTENTKEIKKNIKDMQNEMENIKKFQSKSFTEETQELKRKSTELEDRHRRNNLRFDRVPENVNESWENTCEKVQSIIKNYLRINKPIIIERAHRVSSQNDNQREKKKARRTIVCKFLNYQDKELIIKNAKNLKGTGIYVNSDFSEETMKLRNELFQQQWKHRDEERYETVRYNNLIVKEFQNKEGIDNSQEF